MQSRISLSRSIRMAGLAASLMLVGSVSAQAQERFALTTPGFLDNASFSVENASNADDCGGKNVSPALSWNNAPAGTKSYAVILHDPDGQKGLGVDHWVHYGIPASVHEIAVGVGGEGKLGGVGGKNSKGKDTYIGPCPPPTDAAHHYVIQLYALDLAPEALAAGLSRTELQAKLKGHVLGNTSVVRRYQR